MFDSMKHSHRDVQVHMWDVQCKLSVQVFPHSLMIQEECDYNACVCETGKGKGCMFCALSQVCRRGLCSCGMWRRAISHKNRDLKVKKILELVLRI
jgi:hypothetical protein